MATIGLSVPAGLTITTETCSEFHENGCKWPEGLWDSVIEGLQVIETNMGARLGSNCSPLLLSIRSGAAVSFPLVYK